MSGTAEALAIVAVLALFFFARRRVAPWLQGAGRVFAAIGRRQGLSIVCIGLMAFGASAALSLFGRMPYPKVHDEFSYLLAADTFARGRVTNPTHPMWVHFESLHIIHQPSYASKYPPAQGLMLAAGKLIGGDAAVGLWIAVGLGAASLCWMLLAWLPPRWAIMGALLVALHPGLLVYWSKSYMGGSLAMLGGALVFGAVRRIRQRPRTVYAVVLGLGLAVLANSRPYEGLVASLPAALWLLIWLLGKNGPSYRVSISKIVLPTVAVLTITAIGMGYYNLRVTGEALRLPYLIHEEIYAIAPFFLWQRPSPQPTYSHDVIRYHHEAALEHYTKQQSLSGFAQESLEKIKGLRRFYFGSRGIRLVVLLPLLMLPWVIRNRGIRFALLTCGVMLAGLAVETWVMPHYAAPIIALVCVIHIQAMRCLHSWRGWRGLTGRHVVWAIGVVATVSFMFTYGQEMRTQRFDWGLERAKIVGRLENDGMRHLVMVRYSAQYSTEHKWAYWEWVYNAADIDDSKVVWARDMSVEQNHKLLDYFSDRTVWLLELHEHDAPPQLVPYPVETTVTVTRRS